ncbi:UNVERIFIED_ORG: hypothetical protein M2435_005840, partial [Rhizobium sophorae]|nr:hypothetical protein [Rhizobium sophorae]
NGIVDLVLIDLHEPTLPRAAPKIPRSCSDGYHHPATSAQASQPSDADDGTMGQGQEAMPGGSGMIPDRVMGRT